MDINNWEWTVARACNADLRERSQGARSDARYLIVIAPDDVALLDNMERCGRLWTIKTWPYVNRCEHLAITEREENGETIKLCDSCAAEHDLLMDESEQQARYLAGDE